MLPRIMSAASLTPLPSVERLSSTVVRILGCNPGPKTLQGTNSYLIGSGERRILLDTSEPDKPAYISALAAELAQSKCFISDVLLTHWHWDHVGSVADVLKLGELSTAGHPTPNVHKYPYATELQWLDGVKLEPISDGQVFEVDGARLTALHTPGHAADHLCFLMEPGGVLFSGDTILGEGTTTVSDMFDYMASLRRLSGLGASQIYPAHGPVLPDAADAIERYLSHRTAREQQIMTALRSSPGPASLHHLVSTIYTGLARSLELAAAANVRAHLVKLQREGAVAQIAHDKEAGDLSESWQLVENTPKM